jgi:hypothetical protein
MRRWDLKTFGEWRWEREEKEYYEEEEEIGLAMSE